MHNLMTVKETAEYLRIPVPTVYYLVQRGRLPAVQIGGRWRIKRDLIDRDILREEPPGKPSVLVVDDEPGIQELLRMILKKSGIDSMVVGTGRDALDALHRRTFDMAFLDLRLPDITGDAIYEKAKVIQPTLPVTIITGYPDSEMLDNILKFGPVTVLKKPLKVDQVLMALKPLLSVTASVPAPVEP